jgi:Carbohydrate binding domain/Beta-galactosidase
MDNRKSILSRIHRGLEQLKRRGFHLALFFAGITLTAMPAVAVVNGGFEGNYLPPGCSTGGAIITGQIAEGWSDLTCYTGAGTSINYAKDGVSPHGGASAQRVEVRSNFAQLVQQARFTTGRKYTAQVWMRARAPMRISLTLRQAPEPFRAYTSATFTVTTQWKEYAIAGLTGTSDGLIIISALSAGTLWVDDASLTSVPTPPPPTALVPKQFFGMHVHSLSTPYPDVDGIGSIRLNGTDGFTPGAGGGSWAGLNPSRGQFEWASLDAHLDRAFAHGADVVMTLGQTPRWASARPNEASPIGPGQQAEPANIQYWRDWVSAIATRYRGRIRYWEVWNEPPGFFSGTPEQLVTMAQEAYAILKRVDPNNMLLGPCSYDFHYLDKYLAAGGGPYTDIVCHHFYANFGPEVRYLEDVPNTRVVMERYGLGGKPLWNTEAGWLRPVDNGPKTFSAQTEAAFVARGQMINWASGLARAYTYAWDDHATNVDYTNADNTTLTLAGIAYREVVSWLNGARMMSINFTPDDTWWVHMTRPDGSRYFIVWNTATTISFSPPAAWGVTMRRTLTGSVSSIAGLPSITIGASPVLLQ